jgi:hypothetical protein
MGFVTESGEFFSYLGKASVAHVERSFFESVRGLLPSPHENNLLTVGQHRLGPSGRSVLGVGARTGVLFWQGVRVWGLR